MGQPSRPVPRLGVHVQPLGGGAGGVGLYHGLDLVGGTAALGDGEDVAGPQLDGGDVGLVAAARPPAGGGATSAMGRKTTSDKEGQFTW